MVQGRQQIFNAHRTYQYAPLTQQYVYPSSIWMMRTAEGPFMFEHMMTITKSMSEKVDNSMDSIFQHLQSHQEWHKLLALENQSVVPRQDDARVGLLLEKGIREVAEVKDADDDEDDLTTFVNTNLAIGMLTATAKKIDAEFQSHIRSVMNRFGDFKAGPIKTVERCQSKVENDYQDADYPKAAKLLDLVRCSVSFNTVEQLLAGYEGLLRHVETGSDSLELARVKNGFLDKQAAFRDIKFNVVFHSETDPGKEVSMICEVQLILNQYLHEKKRIHKLYSILRERTYFEMVVKVDGQENETGTVKDIKDLQFEPVLNVEKEVDINIKHADKCSIDTDLMWLGIDTSDRFFCVDMVQKKVVLEKKSKGEHSHHWLTLNAQKYLALQVSKNQMQMFKVDQETKAFEEDETLKVELGDWDNINFSEFDRKFEHLFLVKNDSILEKRSLRNVGSVAMSIELEEKIGTSRTKLLALSSDGSFGVVGGGTNRSYFYLLDLEKKTQRKWESKVLTCTNAPCFINGDAEYVAVGGGYGAPGVQIWDIEKNAAAQVLEIYDDFTTCTFSINNILAVGLNSKALQLWDVRDWTMFQSFKYSMNPRTITLTDDARYLSIGGGGGEKCVVLQIK